VAEKPYRVRLPGATQREDDCGGAEGERTTRE